MPVRLFLVGHFLENFGRGRIALGQIFGERHVNARILLLGGDSDGENFALVEFGEGLQGKLRAGLDGGFN